VRVQVNEDRRSTEQPVNESLLTGYKRLSELALDEERRLLLPQTGTTGWLQLGFGAAGFGTGGAGSDQTFSPPAGGGGGNAPLERYFEPEVLHAVESTVHAALSRRDDYLPCRCPYCPALFSSVSWSYELAALHQIFHAGLLAGRVANPDARGGAVASVRRIVRRAVAAADVLALAGPSEPRHLSVWDRLL
jgi:hypothetical protein